MLVEPFDRRGMNVAAGGAHHRPVHAIHLGGGLAERFGIGGPCACLGRLLSPEPTRPVLVPYPPGFRQAVIAQESVTYRFPKFTGRMMAEPLGKWNVGIAFIGFHLTFFPMHITGLLGMPRRVYTYPAGMGWDGAQSGIEHRRFRLRGIAADVPLQYCGELAQGAGRECQSLGCCQPQVADEFAAAQL